MGTLKNKLPDKEFLVLSDILSLNYKNISPDFVRMDKAFRLIAKSGSAELPKPTPQRHLMNMFKILYSLNMPFNLKILPLITTVYLSRMSGGVQTTPRLHINKKGMYASILNYELFISCLSRYKQVQKDVEKFSCNIPIDIEKGIRFTSSMLDMDTKIASAILDARAINMERFESDLAKRVSPFSILNGIAFPTYEVAGMDHFEEL